MENSTTRPSHPSRKWGKRAGIAAIVFFTAKGLVWLGIAAAGAYYALY